MKRKYELIRKGNKFGKWTSLENEVALSGQRYILCQCDCGTIRKVATDSLWRGTSKSCGCVSGQKTKDRYKRKIGDNKIEICNNYAKVYMKNDDYFIVDVEDIDKIKQYTWHRNFRRGNYITANKRIHLDGTKGTLQLARYIMDCPYDMIVDHINGNVSDNRKSNLRICTNQQNSCNSTISKRNTSGHSGIYWDKERENTKNERYQAYVGDKGKRYRGNFKVSDYGSKEQAYKEACKWQEEMANKLRGEFSVYNSRN